MIEVIKINPSLSAGLDMSTETRKCAKNYDALRLSDKSVVDMSNIPLELRDDPILIERVRESHRKIEEEMGREFRRDMRQYFTELLHL